MRIEDFTFEVRDDNLNRLGQLLPGDLVGWESVLRFNNVGMWSIQLVANLPMAQLLSTPGYGIVVSHKTAGVILSGPMISAETTYESGDPIGVIKITGVDDSVILADRLAYPDPTTDDVAAQSQAYDSVSSMFASTALFHYVEGNLISGVAPVARAIPGLALGIDAEVGSLVSKSARFDVLGELLSDIASVDGLGFDIKQVDGQLLFDVYEPVDRTGYIRMDVANQTLSKTSYGYGAPELTRAIVAGQGEGTNRQFLDITTAESLSAETQFGRRIESFVDQRNTADENELEQAGLEKLASGGMLLTTVDVIPSSDLTMRYGDDWNLGDQVTVVVANQEVSATVTQVSIRVEPNGVFIGATVGEPNGVDFEAIVAKKQTKAQTRINALERKEAGQVATEHVIRAKNDSGTTAIPAMTVVMFAGATGDTVTVSPAVSDGSIDVQMLVGITATEIPADGFGNVMQLGFIDHVDTDQWTLGTILYPDPTVAGGLTATLPTSPAWTIPIAAVTRSHANSGRILVRAIPSSGGGGSAGSGIVSGDTAPANPVPDMAWFDTTTMALFIWFDDGDSTQWVEVRSNSAINSLFDSRISTLESRATVLEGVRPVSIGGTGASSFTAGTYLKGNGTSAIAAQTGIPIADVSGQLPIAQGGSGVTIGTGLVPMVPTSLTGSGGSASFNSVGKVTLSASGQWMLNGVFTDQFKNYLVVMHGYCDGDRGFGWRFAQNGAQNTNAYYHYAMFWNGGSGMGTAAGNSTTFVGYSLGHRYVSMTMNIHAPKATGSPHHMIAQYSGLNSATNGNELHTVSGILRDGNFSADGLFGFVSAGNFTGTIQVFGLRDS